MHTFYMAHVVQYTDTVAYRTHVLVKYSWKKVQVSISRELYPVLLRLTEIKLFKSKYFSRKMRSLYL